MAQLLLISDKSLSDKDNRKIDDIVGIFDDNHVFSDHEKEIFTIINLPAVSKDAEILTMPKTYTANRSKTTDWTLDRPEEKNVWQDKDGSWKAVEVEPRFPAYWDNAEVKERFSEYAENHTILIAADKVK